MGGFSQYLQAQQQPPASLPQQGPQTPGQLTFMLALAAMRHRMAAQQQPPPQLTPVDPEYQRGYALGLQMAKGSR